MKSYLKTRDFSVSQEEFELLWDEKKDLLITDPKPASLESYYNSQAYISHTDAEDTFFNRLYQLVKRYTLSRKEALASAYCSEKKTVLDIGSGTGDFLLIARNKGWQIAGVEPNSNARERSKRKGVQVQSDLASLNGKSFQVITLWHVLEHLPDLENAIVAIRQLLDDKGTLIIAVPNFKSYDAKYYREYWAAYDVPRHLWHFSRKAMQQTFEGHGFQVVSTLPMWLDAFYVSMLSERYQKRSLPFLRGMLIGAWSNFKALFSSEWSSQIYILQKQ